MQRFILFSCTLLIFTFHYVSILITLFFSLIASLDGIYIPLCLYFNPRIEAYMDAVETFTFHYVSILIVLILKYCFSLILIYIPLCLYFNVFDDREKKWLGKIYIPLCLYFNVK